MVNEGEIQVDSELFKQALSRFPAGVTVVTTIDDSGRRWGFTASSFTSVSLDPPQVLVCLDDGASCADAFARAGKFAVNILGPADTSLAWTFATTGAEKFIDTNFGEGALGLPVLDSAIAAMECDISARYPGGDHTILLGTVLAARNTDGEPVLYAGRQFHRLGDPC